MSQARAFMFLKAVPCALSVLAKLARPELIRKCCAKLGLGLFAANDSCGPTGPQKLIPELSGCKFFHGTCQKADQEKLSNGHQI